MAEVIFRTYQDESDLASIKALIGKDLSEPYSVYTYRYFLNSFPHLSFLALKNEQVVGVVVCKIDNRTIKTDDNLFPKDQDAEKEEYKRGYIGMLTVDEGERKQGIGSTLIKKAVEAMEKEGCKEIVLETETKNTAAIQLYERLGFIKDKRLEKYYLNGGDAYRLKK